MKRPRHCCSDSRIGGHQLADVFATLSRAFVYYAEAGNIARAVAAAEFQIARPGARIPGVAQLLARALTLVPAESHEAGHLLSRYGGILGVVEGDYEGAQQALGRAMDIARSEGDVPLEVQTLTQAAIVSGQHLQWQQSVDNGRRAIELATGDENTLADFLSHFWTVRSLLQLGDLDPARPHASVLRNLLERRTTPRQLAGPGFSLLTSLSCLEGDWKAGRKSIDEGLEVSPLNLLLLALRVLLEYETGELAQGEVYLDRFLEVMQRAESGQLIAAERAFIPAAIATIARISSLPDRLGVARTAAEAVLSEQSVTPFSPCPLKLGWPCWPCIR